jgi:hypothetical protein
MLVAVGSNTGRVDVLRRQSAAGGYDVLAMADDFQAKLPERQGQPGFAAGMVLATCVLQPVAVEAHEDKYEVVASPLVLLLASTGSLHMYHLVNINHRRDQVTVSALC